MKEIYLLWVEGKGIKVFDNFDEAVMEYVRLENEKAIIKVEAHKEALYSCDDEERYINILVMSPAAIWKRAYQIKANANSDEW